jgi:hypothetical protein
MLMDVDVFRARISGETAALGSVPVLRREIATPIFIPPLGNLGNCGTSLSKLNYPRSSLSLDARSLATFTYRLFITECAEAIHYGT